MIGTVMSRKRLAAAAAAMLVIAGFAMAGMDPPQRASAAEPDFSTNRTANYTAMLVGTTVNEAFSGEPAFFGLEITKAGLEASFSTAPNEELLARLTALQDGQQEALVKNPRTPQGAPFVPITFRQVPYSMGDLMALTNRIRGDQPKWAAAGVQLTTWGPNGETVSITLARYSADYADQLVKAYGPMVRVSTKDFTAEGSSRPARQRHPTATTPS
jgi:hypothetical protein